MSEEFDFAARYDPAGFGQSLAEVGAAVARDPLPALRGAARLAHDVSAAWLGSAGRVLGVAPVPDVNPAPSDRRFADPAWEDNPWFLTQRGAYEAWTRYLRSIPGDAGLVGTAAQKAMFAIEQVADAAAPTNYLWGNPAALRRAVETRGTSLVKGLANLLDDVVDNRARPRQVESSSFRVGENLACTPGKVVFRNELFELLQYEPTTASVFDVPLLCSPPWINRYYVMDLAPGRSFVEWAVAHGHSTFAMSYRNPDASMRDVGLDAYLQDGLRTALDVVRTIAGTEQVNVAGLCVGGTLATMLLAWLADAGEHPVRSVTLLNTLVDFSEPGALAAFTDAEAVERMEQRMAETGYLDGREMATTFDALRPKDLIWNYVGANWLMGETPPAFDILAWNADPICISEATHSQYLRAFYRENLLSKGAMTAAGRPLRLGKVTTDAYVLAAKEDHITPWKSSYATTGLLDNATVRFVLSSAGHIAGIVNPPGPKRRHWTNDALPADPEAWLDGAAEHSGTWWEDWAAWIGERAGGLRRPPGMGSADTPVLGEAPGTYVHG